MEYLILTAKIDNDGMLKDLREIRELARKLDSKAMELQRRLTIEESAEDKSSTDPKQIIDSASQ